MSPFCRNAVGVAAISYLVYRYFARPSQKNKSPKVILITGASAGIGQSAALRLVRDGHTVYGAARRDIPALVRAGGSAIAMDVTNESDRQNGIRKILDQHGRIDILINNAGYGNYGPAELVTLEEGRRQFEVNFFAAIRLIQLVIPYMRQNGGTIINVSSVASVCRNPLASWYFSTKAALENWTNCFRLEAQQYGIRVVVVRPGCIRTEFMGHTLPALLEMTQGTRYESAAKHLVKNLQWMFRYFGTDPAGIANIISDVCKTENPKRVYTAGGLSHLIEFEGTWMPNNFQDFAATALTKL